MKIHHYGVRAIVAGSFACLTSLAITRMAQKALRHSFKLSTLIGVVGTPLSFLPLAGATYFAARIHQDLLNDYSYTVKGASLLWKYECFQPLAERLIFRAVQLDTYIQNKTEVPLEKADQLALSRELFQDLESRILKKHAFEKPQEPVTRRDSLRERRVFTPGRGD